MIQSSKLVVTIVLIALVIGINSESDSGEKSEISETIDNFINDINQWMCNNVGLNGQNPLCSTTTTTRAPATTGTSGSSTTSTSTTTSSPSPLESAHWCKFKNGTYIPLGYTFMNTACNLCQCTQAHAIRCTTLQCMTTYCIDGSKPVTREGQCCSQCAYEQSSTSCVQNGVKFPHGTVIKSTDTMRCWCQLGLVECRKAGSSAFSTLDLWGAGTAVYVIVVIIVVILLFGTFLCCGCTLLYYYYYQNNQQAVQDAYEQYWNNAGWQPMPEEGNPADASAEEKQAEAEQSQYQYGYPTGGSESYVPPPYAIYNGSYAQEETGKEQKPL